MKEKFYEITEEDNDSEEDFDQNKIKEYFKNPNKTKYEANIRNFNLSRYRFSEIKTQLKNKN